RDLERARTLFEGGAISREALERAESAHEQARAAAEQATEQLGMVRAGPRAARLAAPAAAGRQARAALEQVESALENAVIRAPFAGRVTVRHREPGETVSPGAPVLTLMDPDDRWVRIYVPENRLGAVRLGQEAAIRSDTFEDRLYPGRVVRIADEAEFTPRNVQTPEERVRLVYAVKVRITGDPALELKPGLPADVRLEPAPGLADGAPEG
ncbi:MAG TPA: HlyD family efflux transporter periplasmic adaptor subunit, partial [Longimicrobiales bacterium]|nr:HlyD family efflux transporter periplasmic adaptor subunit [Longimicrobiales bacterium]